MERYDGNDDMGDRVHKKTRAPAKKVYTRTTAAARAFVDPAFPWPVEVAGDVQFMATAYYHEAADMKRIGKPRHRWSDADFDWPDASDASASVRLLLGLPPAGEGC